MGKKKKTIELDSDTWREVQYKAIDEDISPKKLLERIVEDWYLKEQIKKAK